MPYPASALLIDQAQMIFFLIAGFGCVDDEIPMITSPKTKVSISYVEMRSSLEICSFVTPSDRRAAKTFSHTCDVSRGMGFGSSRA